MQPEFVTLAGIIINSIFWIINSVVLYKLNKKAKSIDIGVAELHELNVKMHDRLVEAEEAIKTNKHLLDKTRIRLLNNASRLLKYDETIINDVNHLINDWTVMLSLKENGNLNSGELSISKTKLIELIREIKGKIDKLKY